MTAPTLDDRLADYLARPVDGDRLPARFQLSPALTALLVDLAAERGVPTDAFVEHLLFKAIRSENARRLVGEKPDPVPASFVDDRVARAKVELAKDVAAIKTHEGRGDRATRILSGMEAMLADATGADPEIDELNRRLQATEPDPAKRR